MSMRVLVVASALMGVSGLGGGAALAQEGGAAAQAPASGTGPFARQYGWTIAHFYESKDAFERARAGTFLPREPRHPTELREGFPYVPRFEAVGDRKRVSLAVPEGATVYGLGDVDGGLVRDEFSGEVPGLHAALMVVAADGSGFALLADTTEPVRVTVGKEISFESAAETLPVLVIGGETLYDIFVSMSGLTGVLEMPPRWALGFGMEAADVGTAERALESAGALGVVWVRVGEDPGALLALAERAGGAGGGGARIGISIDECGADPAPAPPTELSGAFLPVEGGRCAVADVRTERGSEWWTAQVARLSAAGVSGALVRWPEELTGVMSRQAVIGARKGIAPDESGRRPWVVGTDWAIGAQRGGGIAVEAGEGAIRRVLRLSLSGAPFVGMRGNSVEEMAVAIACMPVAVGVADAEGRLAGDQELLRKLVRIRTRLEPYLYTQTFNAFFQGQPVVQPVFMADPTQPGLRNIEDAFLLGADLLVVPRGEGGQRREPPIGGWRRIDLGEEAPEIPDFYLRPGRSLPTASPDQNRDRPLDPLILLANLDGDGRSTDVLFEDSGDGYSFYRNDARRVGHRVEVQQDGMAYVRLSQLDGGWGFPERKLIVHVLRDDGAFSGQGSEKATLRIRMDDSAQGGETAPR